MNWLTSSTANPMIRPTQPYYQQPPTPHKTAADNGIIGVPNPVIQINLPKLTLQLPLPQPSYRKLEKAFATRSGHIENSF